MGSPQSLSEADRRLVAAWAADCAERVISIFEAAAPGDERPRALLARALAFSRRKLGTADEIRRRFSGVLPATLSAHAPAMLAEAEPATLAAQGGARAETVSIVSPA